MQYPTGRRTKLPLKNSGVLVTLQRRIDMELMCQGADVLSVDLQQVG
jgi:hypothetical protein